MHEESKRSDSLVYIETGNIFEHPANPRKNVGDVTELAESIKVNGVLQNLTVVPYYSQVHKREMEGLYTVIIGHRRLAACKLAGIEKVPCVVAHMSDQEQVRTMMIENMQRSDLTLLEEADGFQMMLDMGESVSSIADQTGISETTVRRRLNLVKLDRDKVQKAQERGATLQDYAKLDQIKNPEKKNEVLSHIGTADFNQKLQTAVREEKDREWLDHIIEQFRESGWCWEINADERNNLKESTIAYRESYSTWNMRLLTKPADADRVRYYFYVGKSQVDLYRTKTAEEAPVSQDELKRRELKRKLDAIMQELEYQDQDFRDLRESFICDFGAFNRHREEIQAFAVRAFLFNSDDLGGSEFDEEELAGFLNIECGEDDELDQKQLNELLWKCPEKVLLYTAYLMLETGYRQWWATKWDNAVKASIPYYVPNPQLDLLYSCLKNLGYEPSTEEQSASGGGRMQFIEAQKLVDQYKEDLKEAGDQA